MFTMTEEWLKKYYGSDSPQQIGATAAWLRAHGQGDMGGGIRPEVWAQYKHLTEYQPNTNDIVPQCLKKIGTTFSTELQAHKFVNLLRVPLAIAYEDAMKSLPNAPETILELGVGGDSAISTSVYLAWVEGHKGHLTSVEHNPLGKTLERYENHSKYWTFILGDSKKTLRRFIEEERTFDLIFVDTSHTYIDTAAELDLAKRMTNVILMDDATFAGNTDDLVPGGVQRAIKEFKITNKDWGCKEFWGDAVVLFTKKQTFKKKTTTIKGERDGNQAS